VITFTNDEPTRCGAVGLDGVLRIGPGEGGLPWGFRGRWLDQRTFRLEFDQIARFEAFELTFHFDGDHVTLDGRERSRFALGLTGRAVRGTTLARALITVLITDPVRR
jgi:hypothetical protein